MSPKMVTSGSQKSFQEIYKDNPLRSQSLSIRPEKDNCIEKFLIFMSYVLVLLLFPLSLFCIFLVVRHFERAVILRCGKVRKNRSFGPGLVHYLPCVDIVKYTDLRIICYAVPPQEALTKDSVSVKVDAIVYYQIYRPVWAVTNVMDFRNSTQYLAATSLRNAIGTKKLSAILVDRPVISSLVYNSMSNVAHEWGVYIVNVEIKDISLPPQQQKSMASEAESLRMSNAKIIVAKAEVESTRYLQTATEILMDNPYCMQLRYLQSLQMICGDKTHTVVIPFSIENAKKILTQKP